MSCLPAPSRLPQRFIDATTSLAVTGEPSWKVSPSRSLKVYTLRSSLTVQLSTICGCGFRFSSLENSVS